MSLAKGRSHKQISLLYILGLRYLYTHQNMHASWSSSGGSDDCALRYGLTHSNMGWQSRCQGNNLRSHHGWSMNVDRHSTNKI
ncbi:unnamed protein product [Lupinus luteus]|uniref:Uncharacterized protein n=1 Tax=Lupinus luteus TaxID=3873 RepID=A0AAV1Y2J9_LUPLU